MRWLDRARGGQEPLEKIDAHEGGVLTKPPKAPSVSFVSDRAYAFPKFSIGERRAPESSRRPKNNSKTPNRKCKFSEARKSTFWDTDKAAKSPSTKDGDPRELDCGAEPANDWRCFGGQHPEDQEHWPEAKRIFGYSFPPSQDPLTELVPAKEFETAPEAVRHLRDEAETLLGIVSTGATTSEPVGIVPPWLRKDIAREREAYLQGERERMAAIRDDTSLKPLRLAIAHEGPGNARVRRFAGIDGQAYVIPRRSILATDSTRALIEDDDNGRKALASPRDRLPGVTIEPGHVEVECSKRYRPEVTMHDRRRLLALKKRGFAFSASGNRLRVTLDGELDDATANEILPRAEQIMAALRERESAS